MLVIVSCAWMLPTEPPAQAQPQPGEEWEWRNPIPQGNALGGVVWANNRFVATGERGTILTSPDGSTWSVHPSGTTSTLRGAAWNGSQFVAVGDNGTILTSPDAASWTAQTSGTTVTLRDITWGGSTFVAVGDRGTICTSPDGVTWTTRNSGVSVLRSLRRVAWGPDLFVVVGDGGTIRTSEDGVTWTGRTSGTSSALMGLTWAETQAGDRFLAVGQSGTIRTSEDGVTWAAQTSGTTGMLYGIAWSGSLFVALGPNGYTFGSPDGITWTPGPNRITATSSLFGITWGNLEFVVVGTAGAIHTSPDGTHWTARTSGPIRDLKDATWGGTQFVAVGEYETILTSPDGLDWTDRTTAPATDFADTLTGVTWGHSQFVAVGYHYLVSSARSVIQTSSDGVNWTSRSPGLPSNATLHAVTWADDQFVAVGDHSTTGVDSPIVTSLDAVTWTPIESGTTAALHDVTGNGQVFVAVGATSTVLTSPSGVDWTVHDISPVFSGTLWGVIWGQNQFVAVGSGGTIVTSPDGATWTKQSSGTSQNLNAITWNDGLFVAVGNGGAILTSPDGVGWTLQRSGWTPDLVGVTRSDTQFVAVGDGGTILNDQASGTPPDPPDWITSPLLSGTMVAGDTLRFTARSVADAPTTYAWDFGDGRVSSLRSPGPVSYTSPGAFRVVCTATVGAATPTSDSRSYTVVADTGGLPDLQVSTVRLDGTLAVGQPMPVTYTANNTGQGPAGPSWRDAVYLSRDPDLDSTDLLLDSALVNRTLAAGESYENVLTVSLPTTYDGACHLILALNDQWDVLERRRSNNERATQITSLVPILSAATPTSVPYAAGRIEQYFRIIATGEENLLLDLTGVPQGLEVLLEFNNLPTGWTYAYRVRGGSLFVLPAATPGDWFLMVSGSMEQPGTYALGFSMGDLLLSSTSPARHNAEADLELTLTGAGFSQPMGVRLVSAQAQVHAAAEVEVDSFSQARARFAAGTVPPGLYGVRVERDGHVAERPNALDVTEGGSSNFKVELILPSAFGYHVVATVFVEYANTGDVPMPAPLLLVTARQNGRPGAILTLDQHRLSTGFWTASMPEGFANSVQFLASGATPGILHPGESRRVPVYYAGWQKPWDFDYPPLQWSVGVLATDNATPVDWDQLKAGMRPQHAREDAWEIVWNNFIALAGSTWGDYVSMLGRNAQYLHRQGVAVMNAESLLAFSMRLADGISPVGKLAGAADAAVRAPGLPILFSRSFLQPISRRFERGDLGRGWTHNWCQKLSVREDQTVILTDSTGTPRLFSPDSLRPRRYLAQPGDHGDMRAVNDSFRLTEVNGVVFVYQNGLLAYVEDPNGNRITCDYAGNRLIRLRHSAGSSLEFTYSPDGFIASVADHVGRQTRYSYDGEHLVSVQAHDGRITMYTYESEGARQHALATIRLPNANTHTYNYDPRGRLIGLWRNDHEGQLDFTLGDTGEIGVTDALGHTTRLFVDHWGRLVKTENPLGEIVQMALNDLGQCVSVTDPDGSSATFDYDTRGNVIAITDPQQHSSRFFRVRAFNRLSRVTDALDRRTEYTYDQGGNLTAIAYPDGTRETWVRNVQGMPTTWTNRRGRPVTFEHDVAGRLTRKGYADGTSAIYRFDARGNLLECEDAGGVTRFTYSEHDYMMRVDYPGQRWLAFTYDPLGRRIATEDQLGHRLDYAYDASSRLRQIASDSVALVDYAYDALGRLARKTLGNGVSSDYTYDAAGRLLTLTNHIPGGEVLSHFAYTYDRRGRRTALQTQYGTWTYTYDPAGQLTRAVLSSTDDAIPNQDLTYEYDALGNRVRTTANGIETACAANNLNQYTTVGNRTYAHDLDGNLIEETGPEGTTIYTYDDENRLVSVTRGADEWRATYDAIGNRVALDENGAARQFVYDPAGLGNLVAEYDAAGNLLSRYAHGLGLVSRWTPTDGAGYYTFDPMSNATELTDETAALQNAYAYRPFGDLLLEHQSIPNPFTFMGEVGTVADPTGQYHVRHREYDAFTGRFTSMDPLGLGSGDMNFYAYAGNQPTMAFDPTGLFGCALASSAVKTTFGSLAFIGGLEIAATAVAAAPPTGGGSLGVAVFGLAVAAGGVYDMATGATGILINGGALIADRAGALSDMQRQYLEAASDALQPSIPGMIVAAATLDWETGQYDEGWAQAVDIVAGVATGTVKPDDMLAAIAEANLDLGLSFGFCAHNKDPVPPPDLPAPPFEMEYADPLNLKRSYDPNAKTGVAGVGEANYVPASTPLAYRIDFENFASATAPAQTVTVRDPLSPDLDWSSLELTEIGFGTVAIPVPPGCQHFETVVDYDYSDEDYDFAIQVHVEAWFENGMLTVHFLSIDPATGLPPAVDVGFLMPETDPTTGRGQGHVSYLIRPKTNLPSGTAIRNVATIQFDLAQEIDTNQVDPRDPSKGTDPNKEALVTIDARAPESRVTALPDQTGRTFLVSWSGQDEAAGSGVASYDILVSTNGVDYGPWLTDTTSTNAFFTGDLGATYWFFSVARDAVGYVEAPPAKADTSTTVSPDSPTSGTVPAQIASVGSMLVFTNTAQSASGSAFQFTLGDGAPEGVSIDPSSGVLRWTPSCAQANERYLFTVWVADALYLNLMDAIPVTVDVGECLVPALDRFVVRAGANGRVPVNLVANVPLTRVTMRIGVHGGRLTNLWIEPCVPEICGSTLASIPDPPAGEGDLFDLSLFTCANQSLQGIQQVAWLHFTALSNQPSAFLNLRLDNREGLPADGSPLQQLAPQTSRLVIVSEEPLLEGWLDADQQPGLILYAPRGAACVIEQSRQLPAIEWSMDSRWEMRDLFVPVPIADPKTGMFFRAVLGLLPQTQNAHR